MKKVLYVLTTLSFVILIESCKKDIGNPNATASFDIELLKKKWTWISATYTFPGYPKANSRYSYSGDSYSDFRADNKVYNYLPPRFGFDTSGYLLRDSALVFLFSENGQVTDSSVAKMLTLNTNTLVFSFPAPLFIEDTITGIETIYAGEELDSLHR